MIFFFQPDIATRGQQKYLRWIWWIKPQSQTMYPRSTYAEFDLDCGYL